MPAGRKSKAIDPDDPLAGLTCSELRRMYRLGEIVTKIAEGNSEFREHMKDALDCFLKREQDRALFDLPPKQPIRH